MYVFNKITVTPQLPERIKDLSVIANNLWRSWNTEFLRLFKQIDVDLWEKVEKNPVKFLKLISQDKLNDVLQNNEFLKQYDELLENFRNYMESKNTWFSKKYPNNKNDLIAYFSAEYGLDEILQIYSGGLGILSADHLKSASDLGVPFVAVGLLYKKGYFHQKINSYGDQETEYRDLDISSLPIKEVKNDNKEPFLINIKLPKGTLYLKVWKINVGRVELYLLDSDIEDNIEEYRTITSTLYGGNQETRIQQEIVLGIGGTKLLKTLGMNPTVYHMNEGHSSFLILELINEIMQDKKVSFNMAKDIVSSKTVFTTHTPVPAGNDIFPTALVETYFDGIWDNYGISKEEFLRLGMAPEANLHESGFNMGIFALKISGKKNGVSKLHGAVSRELFAEVWPNIIAHESPITYVTNGIHTCSWLAPNLKKLYNKYLIPFWQDMIYDDNVWKNIKDIPDNELWDAHIERKRKLLALVKDNTAARLKRNGYSYDEIAKVVAKQKELGFHVITDGEFRRTFWHLDFMWGLDGVEHVSTGGGVQFNAELAVLDDTYLVGKVKAKPHPFVEYFKFLKQFEDENTVAKYTIPAPAQTFQQMIVPANYETTRKFYETDEELIQDIGLAYQDVIRQFYDAGCRNLQLDDCTWGAIVGEAAKQRYQSLGVDIEDVKAKLLAVNNLALEGKPEDMVITSHICRGNYHSTYFTSGAYDTVADYVFAKENVDALFLEYDDERSGGFLPLEKVSDDKKVVLGLITTKSPVLEDKEKVIERIHEAAQYVPLDRLCLSPQCGFASCEIGNKLTEEEQWAKLKLVKEIAEEVWGKEA